MVVIFVKDANNTLQYNIDNITKLIVNNSELVVKKFFIGKETCIESAIIYIDGLVNKNIIDRDVLNPLMLHVKENLINIDKKEDYICKKYITISSSYVEKDINKALDSLKRGKTLVLLENCSNFIILDTSGGEYRNISDHLNESSVRGPRDGFVENLSTNISLLQRRLKQQNLVTEKLVLGRRSETDIALMYIDDIVDKNLLEKIKNKINSIDIDSINTTGIMEQCIEQHTLSIFPQFFATERSDIVQANLLEGRIAILIEGTCFVITVPAVFVEFFQTVEDYYHRTIVSSAARILRYIAAFIVITLPSVYLTLIKFNSELIPITFMQSIIQSRQGIALTPFMSMISMNLIVEFLREGGLRLPGKIGQTLSVVGGIIIGDAAIQAKIISSVTLLIIGITTVATFLIPNYEMSLSIRLLNYPMLILSNWLGMLGVGVTWFFIIAYLCSLDSFGVPYFSLYKNDMKDTFIRSPIWTMNKRPEVIPNNNSTRQTNFKLKFRRKKNG
ncbi:spore germination protein [Haloimpatiens sp. FM7330]|uniref:spore germination protein n=1 Tax=Haloimpatiens sp. FM7330 TaxID=3298610 RepID=UPI003633826E